jgi:hypothetical protein
LTNKATSARIEPYQIISHKEGVMKEKFESKKYQDTRDGAIAALNEVSSFNLKPEDVASAKPDPSVAGVWLIMFKEPRGCAKGAIVYMKGHKDPLGKERDMNDFEEVWG